MNTQDFDFYFLGFHTILESLDIGSVSGGETDEDDGHDDHAGHDHKRSIRHQKRSTGYAHKLHKRSADHSAAEQVSPQLPIGKLTGIILT